MIVLILSDCIVYSDPKFQYHKFGVMVNHTIRHNQKTKKWPHTFFQGQSYREKHLQQIH